MSARRGSSHSYTLGILLRTHDGLLTSRRSADILEFHPRRVFRSVNYGLLNLRMRGRRSPCECLRKTTSASKQVAAGEAPASNSCGKLGKNIASNLRSGARQPCAVANPDKYAAKVGESRMTEAA